MKRGIEFGVMDVNGGYIVYPAGCLNYTERIGRVTRHGTKWKATPYPLTSTNPQCTGFSTRQAAGEYLARQRSIERDTDNR